MKESERTAAEEMDKTEKRAESGEWRAKPAGTIPLSGCLGNYGNAFETVAKIL